MIIADSTPAYSALLLDENRLLITNIIMIVLEAVGVEECVKKKRIRIEQTKVKWNNVEHKMRIICMVKRGFKHTYTHTCWA